MYSKQDIVNSIKHLNHFLNIDDLKGSDVLLKSNGEPYMHVGGFNMVFKLLKNKKKWAFRVWHTPIDADKKRFKEISTFLENTNLHYFTKFIYDEQGLFIKGKATDTIRMEWLEIPNLSEYLGKNILKKKNLENLAENFKSMCKELRENNISHGDLQHGNILVDPSGNIKLIDYDSICIPTLEGSNEISKGYKGYQHPSRFSNEKCSLKADYFSELIIYLSIIALAEAPNLWDKYKLKEADQLFIHTDFENLSNSNIYKDLMSLSSNIQAHVKVLEHYLKEPNFKNLSPFPDTLQALFKDPKIAYFKADRTFLPNVENNIVKLSWNTSFANNIKLNIKRGLLKEKGSIEIPITNNKEIKLTATNALGVTDTHSIAITVSDEKPKIKLFKLDRDTLDNENPAQLDWNILGAKEINISTVGNNLPHSGSEKIHVLTDTKIELQAISHFGVEIRKTIELKTTRKGPIIHNFKPKYENVAPNFEVDISWSVENAKKITIRDLKGEIIYEGEDLNHNINYWVGEKSSLILNAENIFGFKSTKKITIKPFC